MSDEIISAHPEPGISPEGEVQELDAKDISHIKLPVFEGPLDLLLYLIKKDELDIYDIPIEHITSQYLNYLKIIKMLDLEIAGDYLVVAATLLYIKSRVILPHDQRPPEDEAEEDDPRWELVRQLVEYKKYKDAAFELQQCLIRQEGVHGRGAQSKPDMEVDGSMPFDKVGLFDLLAVFQKILDRANKDEDLRDIFEDKFTVSDKIQFILGRMVSHTRIVFETLFTDGSTRTEIVVTFLAVLELIRLKQIGVTQDGVFGSIEIVKLAATNSDFAASFTPQADEVPEPQVEAAVEPASEIQAEPEIESAPEAKEESEPEAESASEAPTEPETEPEEVFDAEPTPEPATEEISESESLPEVEPASEPEPSPGVTPEPENEEAIKHNADSEEKSDEEPSSPSDGGHPHSPSS